ncbi:hypothetical protein EJB05_25827, partial [Eragrostis curvula]
MYNLNRASQISFPGEDILQRARIFSYDFLRQREARGMLHDKWIIVKDLAAEVQYTLDFPWYASLPRVEARIYLDQYGGNDDVWIGKTFYRMPLVNNNVYHELARNDFNRCQVVHQLECHGLHMWSLENGLEIFGVTPEDILRAYFLAAACTFEPYRAAERLAWARAILLANTISEHFHNNLHDKKRLECFVHCLFEETDVLWKERNLKDAIITKALSQLIDLMAREAQPVHGGQNYTHNLLRLAWTQWMMQKIDKEKEKYSKSNVKGPRHMVHDGQTCLLLFQIIEICAGRIGESSSMINNKDNDHFIQLCCSVCDYINHKVLLSQDTESNEAALKCIDKEIDWAMQELAQCLLLRSDECMRNRMTKQTLWNIVRSSYYATHCPSYMMDRHVSKVIFEPV